MSYHYSDVTKISDLEELAYDLQADHCLLLMAYDCFHNDDAGDYSKDSLELLTWNQLQMLKQHIDDLWWFYRAICNCGLSKIVLSKRSDSESSSGDPFFGSTDPEVIHDLGVALMLAEDGFFIDRESEAYMMLHRLTNECWKRQPLEDDSDEA